MSVNLTQDALEQLVRKIQKTRHPDCDARDCEGKEKEVKIRYTAPLLPTHALALCAFMKYRDRGSPTLMYRCGESGRGRS